MRITAFDSNFIDSAWKSSKIARFRHVYLPRLTEKQRAQNGARG
jgi:hypothetical protein